MYALFVFIGFVIGCIATYFVGYLWKKDQYKIILEGFETDEYKHLIKEMAEEIAKLCNTPQHDWRLFYVHTWWRSLLCVTFRVDSQLFQRIEWDLHRELKKYELEMSIEYMPDLMIKVRTKPENE